MVCYQYSVKLCSSQDEEMSIIGALCYSSLFLYRNDLLQCIKKHKQWMELNQSLPKPIIINFVIKPFCSPGKSTDVIFVHSERSKKELARDFFLSLYDGTPKEYPRGDMLLFIPVASKLEDEYTDEQQTKFLFNHNSYLGEEDCTAIFGLADLNGEVTLTDGTIITLCTLLKSPPASQGMSRPRLFQVVDPNAAQNCILVTFQCCDHPFVEACSGLLVPSI